MKKVENVRKQLRKESLESSLDDISGYEADPNYERTMLAYYSLTPDEKSVFDYSTGSHGQPKLSPGDISLRMKISPGRVSQYKTQIANKIKPYLV
jgi:DNA-binding CsgD family transcriptional regulator